MSLKEVGSILWKTMGRFMDEGAMRYGAALAFYATLSLAPLLLLGVSTVSLLARDALTAANIVEQLTLMIGERGAEIANQILENAPDENRSLIGIVGSGILLLAGGTVLFVNLQGTLNSMWNVKRRDEGIVRGFVRARVVAFLMILATGGVLLISLLLGAAANWIAPAIENRLPVGSTLVMAIELAVSGSVLTLLCAATYRILPDVEIAWRDVWVGATLTAILFLAGRAVIGWYLSSAAVGSRFGAAGSLVVFLVWLYYSAQIFFFGAEFTQVWAERRGVPIRPSEGAVRVESREFELPG
jgi:membrane protein